MFVLHKAGHLNVSVTRRSNLRRYRSSIGMKCVQARHDDRVVAFQARRNNALFIDELAGFDITFLRRVIGT